jgi:hypothetical protein
MNGNTARFARDLAGWERFTPYAAETLHQIDDVFTLCDRLRSSGFAGFFLTIGGATVVPVVPGRPLAGHFPGSSRDAFIRLCGPQSKAIFG